MAWNQVRIALHHIDGFPSPSSPGSRCLLSCRKHRHWVMCRYHFEAANDGFAHRNNENLDLPDSKWTAAVSTANFPTTEVRVPAGKPLVLHFMGPGRVTAYAREQCFVSRTFIPEPGHNYELVMIEDGSSCRSRMVDFIDAIQESPVKTETTSFCRKSHSFM